MATSVWQHRVELLAILTMSQSIPEAKTEETPLNTL
jgi:hypothetical protein